MKNQTIAKEILKTVSAITPEKDVSRIAELGNNLPQTAQFKDIILKHKK